MSKSHPKDNTSNLLPKLCRTCTCYLKEVLPKPSCYTSCPKNNPVNDIENSLSLGTKRSTDLGICPKCNTKSLLWRKDQLVHECLHCKKTYTVNALKTAQHNAEAESKNTGYLQAKDGYDA